MSKIAVLGGGSWGSAIAQVLGGNGHSVALYIKDPQQYQEVRATGKNEKYLEDFTFLSEIEFHNSLAGAVEGAEAIILAVPTNAARSVATELRELNLPKMPVINLAKGLEENSHLRVSQVVAELLPEHPYLVLSGPSHAEEVAREIPTTVAVAGGDDETRKWCQKLFSNDFFRVYTQRDLIGVELGGALKNIIALGCGISDGLGFGDNTKAAMMTRGMVEIQRLGVALGADPKTFQGLSGMGDLIVTCTSLHSRNRSFGYHLGQGKTVEEAMEAVRMVVEGYKTTRACYELAKEKNIEMPITEKLYGVLYRGEDPSEAVLELMVRPHKREDEDDLYR
ncbi:MAG: NAD(P)H-dependent glycerol-3-phosphate dehydrogenase [Tissierellia bacterium]|nr:NAD(P)H-dependent glycerol-3-phosphate dehydrogenase [Tissierellia bacterium]